MQTEGCKNVLIVDDDEYVCKMLTTIVRDLGYTAISRHTIQEGLAAMQATPFEVVMLDVGLPDGNGLDQLATIKEKPNHPSVIIITGYGNNDGAEIAIRNGAWDYIQKSDSYHKVALSLRRVFQYRRHRSKTVRQSKPLKLNGIVGNSPAIRECYETVAKAAANEASVLITGETGTGKELFARAIHENSDRFDKNLVVVDCAALPETLVESLLFGHEKGSFTGADRAREGVIAQADGGTLFLDEVGEMPPVIQKKFLRVLQERRFRPVGGSREIRSNFRLIAATNQNLEQMVAKGLFRKDLLYRLSAVKLALPPLRNRESDIRLLAGYYAEKICARCDFERKRLSSGFLDTLECYDWPGNIRELVNVMEGAIAGNITESKLFANHLPKNIRLHAIRSTLQAPEQEIQHPNDTHGAAKVVFQPPVLKAHDLPPLKVYRQDAVASAEKAYLNVLLASFQNNTQEAMDVSGLSKSRFYQLVKRYELSV